MTLGDLERRNSPYFAFFFHRIRLLYWPITSTWLKVDLVRKILSPSSSLPLLAITITDLQRDLSATAELLVFFSV